MFLIDYKNMVDIIIISHLSVKVGNHNYKKKIE